FLFGILEKLSFIGQLSFVREIFLGFVGSALSIIICRFFGIDDGPLVTGLLLTIFPGTAMINSIRNIIAGDLISGAVGVLETAGLMLSLFASAGAVLSISGSFSDVIAAASVNSITLALYPVLAGISNATFFTYFQGPWALIFSSVAVGVLGRIVYSFIVAFNLPSGIGLFLAGATVALIAEHLARYHKTPSTLFVISGFIPLVPASIMYQAVLAFATNSLSQGGALFLASAIHMFALGTGIATVTAMIRSWK
ncbi:threonine/serine exporter family protein, partial [Heliobacterium chlorum]